MKISRLRTEFSADSFYNVNEFLKGERQMGANSSQPVESNNRMGNILDRILKQEIDKHIARIKAGENTELIERIELFYDGYD